jgi:hypothetical protein
MITKFDNNNLNLLRSEMSSALKEIETKYGIKFDLGNISYSANEFSMKVKSKVLNASTKIPSILEGIMDLHNLQIEGTGGRKLVDYRKSSYKYPFIYSDNGKMYKCDLTMAKIYFSKK